jgi:hypothetical protein
MGRVPRRERLTSRERVLTALQRKQPDRVPYCELGIDRALAQELMGWGTPTTQAANLEKNAYTPEESMALAAHLHLDNITYVMRAPVYAKREAGKDGRLFYGEGLIKSEADLDLLKLPDPHDGALYAEMEPFVRQKGDYSSWFVTRMGIFPTMLGMGTENFCLALYENRPFIEAVLDRYVDWTVVVAERVCRMGFEAEPRCLEWNRSAACERVDDHREHVGQARARLGAGHVRRPAYSVIGSARFCALCKQRTAHAGRA